MNSRFVKHVALVGMPGSGKSALAAGLHRQYGLCWTDTDAAIVTAAGKSIVDIFSEDGESAFRQYEYDCIVSALAMETPTLLATGGGAFIQPHTRTLLQAHAATVYVAVSLPVLIQRLQGDTSRPLLQDDDMVKRLTRLYHDRESVYQQADMVFENTYSSTAQATKAFADFLAQQGLLQHGD